MAGPRSFLLCLGCVLAVACGRKEVVEGYPASYVGVGLELGMDGDAAVVVRVLQGGAAEASGIAVGDRIVAIDGESTAGKTLGDVVMRLRGAPETQVTVTVVRGANRVLFVLHRAPMAKERGEYAPGVEPDGARQRR